MLTLEQVKTLETKVIRLIEYAERVSRENSELQGENSELQGKLDSCQKRNDELEVLIQQLGEDQDRIAEKVHAAIERLNKFEDKVGDTLEIGITALPASRPGPKAPHGKPKEEDPPAEPYSTPPQPEAIAEPVPDGGPEDPLSDENPGEESADGGEDFSGDSPAARELDIF
jgi:peptidoglycan hydrolase CwlO-like protein